MFKYIFISILFFPLSVLSQQPLNPQNDSLSTLAKKDTVVIFQKALDPNSSDYVQILEKTNQQLSLWWNPYGVFIAILGVLFAVLAIIAAFVIYRQSKEHKELIKSSLYEHQAALDKLITEKNNQLKLLESSYDKTIFEYTQKLNSVGEEGKMQISEFISKLEAQKEFIDTQAHTYRHSGWEAKDINEKYPIDATSIFQAKITLNDPIQAFVIYIRVITNEGKQFWLGFAGNEHDSKVTKYRSEFTFHKTYNNKDVLIYENIYSYFKRGFPEGTSVPIFVTTIRLRASNVDLREILFSYKIF